MDRTWVFIHFSIFIALITFCLYQLYPLLTWLSNWRTSSGEDRKKMGLPWRRSVFDYILFRSRPYTTTVFILAVILCSAMILTTGKMNLWGMAEIFNVGIIPNVIAVVITLLFGYKTKSLYYDIVDRYYAVVGAKAVVSKKINGKEKPGQVKIRNVVWDAITTKNTELPSGENVIVRSRRGQKVFVVSEKVELKERG